MLILLNDDIRSISGLTIGAENSQKADASKSEVGSGVGIRGSDPETNQEIRISVHASVLQV